MFDPKSAQLIKASNRDDCRCQISTQFPVISYKKNDKSVSFRIKNTFQVSLTIGHTSKGEMGSLESGKKSKIGLQLTPFWSALRFFGSVIYSKRLIKITYKKTAPIYQGDGKNFEMGNVSKSISLNGTSVKFRSL